MRQLPLSIRLRESSVFETYLSGPNLAAVNALRQLQRQPYAAPIWLFGPSGSGKTHLLQAVCAAAGLRQETIAYFPLHDVMSLGPEALEGCGQLAYVCMDDVSLIAGHQLWERAIFRLLIELQENGGRLLLAAEYVPSYYSFALKDLASRLGGGILLKLRPLEDEEQLIALQQRAAQRGLEMPQETAAFLSRRLRRDMNSLCDFLDRLDEASLIAQRRLTIPFVRQVLDEGT